MEDWAGKPSLYRIPARTNDLTSLSLVPPTLKRPYRTLAKDFLDLPFLFPDPTAPAQLPSVWPFAFLLFIPARPSPAHSGRSAISAISCKLVQLCSSSGRIFPFSPLFCYPSLILISFLALRCCRQFSLPGTHTRWLREHRERANPRRPPPTDRTSTSCRGMASTVRLLLPMSVAISETMPLCGLESTRARKQAR